MKQATHFIEQYKNTNSGKYYHSTSPMLMRELKMAITFTKNVPYFETVAIFKIYPKVKSILAHYDNNVNAVIIE